MSTACQEVKPPGEQTDVAFVFKEKKWLTALSPNSLAVLGTRAAVPAPPRESSLGPASTVAEHPPC